MAFEHILYDTDQGVARITLNRPEVLNSFNRTMAAEVRQALSAGGADAEVRAVLITGAGRAFCAGQDLAEAMPSRRPEEPADLGVEGEKSGGIADRRARGFENPRIREVVARPAGERVEGLDRKGALEVKVTVREPVRRGHG